MSDAIEKLSKGKLYDKKRLYKSKSMLRRQPNETMVQVQNISEVAK